MNATAANRCDVWVRGQRIARLYREGDFQHSLDYDPAASDDAFVSLLMPVRLKDRVQRWEWPELHPFFRMNLPEGAQLNLLKERYAARLDGTDLTLLGLVGVNAIGRVKVVPADQSPTTPPEHFQLGDVLKGDNREDAFAALMREHVLSAVSGVMPKFLAPRTTDEADAENESDAQKMHKATLVTPRAIVKGSSAELPYLALNEHLAMEVARRAGLPAPATTPSEDGLALVVSRFDTDEHGEPVLGVEDFCSLLGMRPAEKYDTTWERIAHRLRALVPAHSLAGELEVLMRHIVLSYVVRNADCHSKNVALVYEDRSSVRLAPAYDVVTTVAYDGYRNSPPALSLAGKKTWKPGKSLQQFAHGVCGLSPEKYRTIVEQTCDAVAAVTPEVVALMDNYPGFRETGKRMVMAWEEGITSVSKPSGADSASSTRMRELLEDARFSDAAPTKPHKRVRVGQSELLGKR